MPERRRLILASASPYRKQLLERLHLPFEVETPDFVETAPGSIPAEQLVRHNTLGKARSIAGKNPDAWVIGADQLAVCGDEVLGKSGSFNAACGQLWKLSGKAVHFLTGLAVLKSGEENYEMVPFCVHFRHLTKDEIRVYVEAEKPWDCAGSFKAEGLGISLFDRLEGDDPTALIGLPLIRLSHYLQPLEFLRVEISGSDSHQI